MKHAFITSAFLFITILLFAQKNAADETAIKKVILEQESAWNKHDWKAFSKYFTQDGTLINFVGQFWQGQNNILVHLEALNDCCLAPTSLRFSFKKARFLEPGIAIVYIEETLFADKDYNVPFHQYKKGDTEYKMLTNIYAKQNGEWKVTAAQLTLINQLLSPHKADAPTD